MPKKEPTNKKEVYVRQTSHDIPNSENSPRQAPVQAKSPQIDTLSEIAEMKSVGVMSGYFKDGFELSYADGKMCRMLGYSSFEEFSKAIDNKADNAIYRDDLSRLKREFGNIRKVGEEYGAVFRMLRKDGSIFWALYKGRKVREADGRISVYGICADVTDITERQTEIKAFAQTLKRKKCDKYIQNLLDEYLETKETLRAESSERLDMIYALSRDYYVLWRVDLNKDLIYLRKNENPNTEKITDRDQQVPSSYSESLEIFGEKWVHPDDRNILYDKAGIENIRKQLEKEESYSVRLRRIDHNTKSYGYVEWRIVPLAHTKDIWMALIAVKDIDGEVLKEARQQELLKNALSQAERANHAKTVFLSNMSHDIRTPMNAIVGFAGIAANHIDDKEHVKDCLEKIMTSSNHLLSLINDILDMSRIESGKVTLQEKECSLFEHIRNLINIVRPQMRAKRLEFHTNIDEIHDEYLIFDPLKLDQVLINILSNAIKFTPPDGKVFFTVEQSASEKIGFYHYEFVIKDTGVGMSKEFLEHIFEPFEREYSAEISNTVGTGLGMAITKNAVDVMGGTISVESEQNKGTCFTVGFDFKLQDISHIKRQDNAIKEFKITDSGRDFGGKRVLIVEDNELNREIAGEIMKNNGFKAEFAPDGSIAVEMVSRSPEGYYDLILMDIRMPITDGYEASRIIRGLARRDAATLPIIAMTANAFEEDKKRSLENGMNAHISKPLNKSVLLNTLDSIFKNK